jgi:hypothetical protein
MSEEPRKKKPRDTSSPTTIGQTTHSVEQDGYGKNIHPTTTSIPIPYSTSFVHGEIVRSIWVDIDFPDMDKKPYIIPYQLLQFGLEFILLKIHL